MASSHGSLHYVGCKWLRNHSPELRAPLATHRIAPSGEHPCTALLQLWAWLLFCGFAGSPLE